VVATSSDPLIGKTFGQVTLSQRLGAGAMGVVYRGWHQRLEREVAVKLLIASRQDKPTYRERFLREGRAAAKVRHEHVVQVLDAGQEGTTAYLVMEFINGRALGDLLDEVKMLAPEVVTRLGAGIALGLAAIHAQGIVHRDIKPDNILVGADRKPRVADLGLAKQVNDPELQRLTATGMVVGTPLYVSPEGIRDPNTISDRSDIYSLGATFYHMLAGRPPFLGDTPYEVMHGHLQGRLTPLRLLRPEIPEGLAHLVERCLSRDPARRPSASEVADQLMAGAIMPQTKSKRGLIIAAVVIVALGAAFVTWNSWPTRATTEAVPNVAQPPPNAGHLFIPDLPADAEVIIDGQPMAIPADGLPLAPGEHRLLAERRGAGPLRRAAGAVTINTGTTTTWNPTFTPVPVTPVRIAVPETGMLFVDGRAYGLDNAFVTEQAGTFHLGRWQESAWQVATLAVGDDGRQTVSEWLTREFPSEACWFATQNPSGDPALAHHVVSWWVAERARTSAGLPAPSGWTTQGASPERPAVSAPAAIVQATLDLLRPWGGDLPDRPTATTLARQLGASVWCRDTGALTRVGGLGAAPVLVLVPGK